MKNARRVATGASSRRGNIHVHAGDALLLVAHKYVRPTVDSTEQHLTSRRGRPADTCAVLAVKPAPPVFWRQCIAIINAKGVARAISIVRSATRCTSAFSIRLLGRALPLQPHHFFNNTRLRFCLPIWHRLAKPERHGRDQRAWLRAARCTIPTSCARGLYEQVH